ncbi:MAG TPA: competence/damage-inducible protein A [Bryobacteraceae bacterium]|nr:competence/damage-inducible protein A [Bryobacteraceae bacterium]
MANAEIIAVGSELLTPQRIDTNSLTLTEALNNLGVEVVGKQVVGDDRIRLTEAIRESLKRAEIVILSGGLGPTEDDITRDAAAQALGRRLVFSPEQETILAAYFQRLNRTMAENNRRQAHLIEGAEALANPNGTAPGQFFRTGAGALILLPGPPRELKPMMENEVVPRLRKMLPRQVIRVRTFRITGIGESDLDRMIAPIYTRYENPATTILFASGDLFVHLRARCDSEQEAEALLKEVGDPIAEKLGDLVYTQNPAESLEGVIGRLLQDQKATIATAESCTGGLIAARLTNLPGSSKRYIGGYITYSEKQKQEVLGVPAELLAQYSAVSRQVAVAMAEGARKQSGATYALSTTGYAGPEGGTEQDPVGTVYVGIVGPHGTTIERIKHGGDRERVRTYSTQSALNILRKTLINHR